MRAIREYLPALGVFILGIALWEGAVFAFSIQFYLLPAPHVIVATLGQTYPVLLEAGLYTFAEALAGYGLGCGLGVLAAMLASRSATVAGLLLPCAIAPHHEASTPGGVVAAKIVRYCAENDIRVIAVRDGEALVVDGDTWRIVSRAD